MIRFQLLQLPNNPLISSLKLQIIINTQQSVHCILTNSLLKELISNTHVPTNQETKISEINCDFKDIIIDIFTDKTYEKIYSYEFGNQKMPHEMASSENIRKEDSEIEDEFVWATEAGFRIKKTDEYQGLTLLFDFSFVETEKIRNIESPKKKQVNPKDIYNLIKRNLEDIERPLCREYVQKKHKEMEEIVAHRKTEQKHKFTRSVIKDNREYSKPSPYHIGTVKSIKSFRSNKNIEKKKKMVEIKRSQKGSDRLSLNSKPFFRETYANLSYRIGCLKNSWVTSIKETQKQLEGKDEELHKNRKKEKDNSIRIVEINTPSNTSETYQPYSIIKGNKGDKQNHIQSKEQQPFKTDYFQVAKKMIEGISARQVQKERTITPTRAFHNNHQPADAYRPRINRAVKIKVSKLDQYGKWIPRKTHKIPVLATTLTNDIQKRKQRVTALI